MKVQCPQVPPKKVFSYISKITQFESYIPVMGAPYSYGGTIQLWGTICSAGFIGGQRGQLPRAPLPEGAPQKIKK